ncbi:hypothetical protein L2E82_40466 [Cichorium intybus]|uniref:Uncharacterized protein n=1 Tax=Cichorium intybus TaxID=13427 RepID=A0ACB9AKD6_CICIN|nr:hypothetical protein L2E82_40466 [Cichorium intybus]
MKANVSEGADMSGSDSAADECSREEEDANLDGKAESEGEAEGVEEDGAGGEMTILPPGEQFLSTAKPLAKRGWELDESIQAAALRETIEEPGVLGTVESELGKWCFKSKGNDAFYEGHMFPFLVKEQLESWPEKDIRQRFWFVTSLQNKQPNSFRPILIKLMKKRVLKSLSILTNG